MNSKYNLEYFWYTTEERLDQVYDRLVHVIQQGKYSVLMGHSMGGALLSRFCRENNVSGYDKIILLMPFIRTSSFLNHLLTLEFTREWRVPKAMLLPKSFIEGVKTTVFSHFVSTLLNDSFMPIGVHQPFYAFEHLFLTDKQIVRFFRKNTNIHLIHSPTDSLVSFTSKLLCRIKNQYSVTGGHLSFSSKKYEDTFFDVLLSVLRV